MRPAGLMAMRRVAVIGAGISGLAAAHALAHDAQVTLFEAGDYFGGHTHTVDVSAADFAKLQNNMSVSLTSSSDGGHTHAVIITCV